MDSDELAQALRDEHAIRLALERRVAQLTEHVEVWRTRAEERAERISALEERTDVPWVRRAARSLRAGLTDQPAPSPTAAVDDGRSVGPDDLPSRATPLHPQVDCVEVLGGDALAPAIAELRATRDVTQASLAAADLVVIDDAGVARLDDAARALLDEWADRPGRAPLVRVVEGPRPAVLVHAEEVLVAPRTVAGATTVATFDARRANPAGPPPDRAAAEAAARSDGVELDDQRPGLVDPAALPGLWAAPPRWFLELAARGLTGWPASLDAGRGGAAARRVAMRRHAPWVAADRLLEVAGVPAPTRRDRVAAIVVSNRPERVTAAVERIGRSRGVELELVVGLHGIPHPEGLSEALDRVGAPTQVRELPASWSLGQCLNACIEATGAPVIAKVDDDDHYGPSHLEDGLQALRYADADLVGKGAQFTYVGPRDTTVLRRPRAEETTLDGTPTGASWVLRRALWEQVGFPHRPRRVDELFLRGARAVGAHVYANSRWEFCYVRGADGHTWTAADETFLAGAEPAWDGHHPERTEVDDSVVGA